jgi:hypothetical protein
VQASTDTVAHEFPHNSEALRFRVLLNGVTHPAKRLSRFQRGDPSPQRLFRRSQQIGSFRAASSDSIGSGGITVPTI